MELVIAEEIAILAAAGVLIGIMWLWVVWDCRRAPHRSLPRRWYQYSEEASLPPRRWDLRELDRQCRGKDRAPRPE